MDFIFICVYIENLKQKDVVKGDFFSGLEPSPCHHIGINSEDKLHDPSLLSKFRTTRLSETTLDDILAEIVRQCVENGIVSVDNGIAIDTTHISANTIKKVQKG